MAQSDFTEAMSSAASGCEMECEQPVQFTNVVTGGLDYNRYLYHQLKCSMQCADRIDMIVSFLMSIRRAHGFERSQAGIAARCPNSHSDRQLWESHSLRRCIC